MSIIEEFNGCPGSVVMVCKVKAVTRVHVFCYMY